VDGEHVWTVAPLATAGTAAPASQLFRERARAVGAAPDDAVVTRIVQRLDGLPLAIEMAAAQLDTTAPEELADALDERLDDLRSARRHVAERHRSLADVLAWSEARLDDDQAATLAELSVFAGPVTLHDLEGVLGRPDAATIVRALAGRSLVNVDRSRSPARFHLLQTIRSFAAQRLAAAGRTDEVGGCHARWFTSEAATADAQLRTADEVRGHERFEAVFPELRAAYRWAAHHDRDLAAELAAHLHVYASSRFVEEPLLWAELLLAQLPAGHPHRPVLLASAATRALRRGDIGEARRLASEAVERAGDTAAALPALDALTDAGLFDGRLDESGRTALAMLDLGGRHGDLLYVALGHSGVALSGAYAGAGAEGAGSAGDTSDAEAELAGLDDRPFPPSGRGWLAYTRAELCQGRDPTRALAHFDDALANARAVGNRYVEGATIVSSCSLRARVGDPVEALAAFGEGVRHWARLANTTQQLTTLRNLAVLFQRTGHAEPLAELLGAVDGGEVPTYGEEADRLRAARAWAVERLGPERFARLSAAGAGLDVTGAAERALRTIDELVARPDRRVAVRGTAPRDSDPRDVEQ
jgi:hypothetical protein